MYNIKRIHKKSDLNFLHIIDKLFTGSTPITHNKNTFIVLNVYILIFYDLAYSQKINGNASGLLFECMYYLIKMIRLKIYLLSYVDT